MLTRKQLLAGGLTGAAGFVASGALGGGKGHGWGTTHKLGRTTTTTPPPTSGVSYPAWVNPSVGAARIGSGTVVSANAKNNSVYYVDFAGTGMSSTTSMFKAIYQNSTCVDNTRDLGVTYTQAHNNGWLLLSSANGPEAQWTQSANQFLPDPGNTGFQQAWALNVYNALVAEGINAVFCDNLLSDYHDVRGDAYRGSTLVTVANWKTSTIAFWNYVGEYLRSRGMHIAGNAAVISDNDASLTKAWWPQLVFGGSFMPGKGCIDWFFVEYYLRFPWSTNTSPFVRLDDESQFYWHWNGWHDLPTVPHSIGSGFIGFDWAGNGRASIGDPTYDAAYAANDDAACTYERATLLLYFDPNYYDCHLFEGNQLDQWTIDSHSVNIGFPTGSAVKQSNGTWTRSFANGQVIVNPTLSTQTTFGHTLTTGTAYIGA